MKFTNEIKVGMMVFAVILCLMILTIKAGNFHFGKKGYTRMRRTHLDCINCAINVSTSEPSNLFCIPSMPIILSTTARCSRSLRNAWV